MGCGPTARRKAIAAPTDSPCYTRLACTSNPTWIGSLQPHRQDRSREQVWLLRRKDVSRRRGVQAAVVHGRVHGAVVAQKAVESVEVAFGGHGDDVAQWTDGCRPAIGG